MTSFHVEIFDSRYWRPTFLWFATKEEASHLEKHMKHGKCKHRVGESSMPPTHSFLKGNLEVVSRPSFGGRP